MNPGSGATGPLSGLVVVELGRFVAAPLAGRLLADWGADVLKVEEPAGDPMRWGPLGERADGSPQFASVNRGKRGVTLDLKSEPGRTALRALVARADVLLHNMRTSALTRLGVDPARLLREHPQLIVCGISGFSDTGPYAGKRTFDSIVSGLSGLFAQFIDPCEPRPVGPAFADLITGMFAAQAVLAALHARSGGAGGQVIDMSMLEATASFIDDAYTTYTEAGVELRDDSRQARQQIFAGAARDGRNLVVQVTGGAAPWQVFVTALGREEWLADARFADYPARLRHFPELTAEVRSAFRGRPRDEWLALFRKLDLPAGPINSIAEAARDPQVVGGAVLVDVDVPGERPLRMTRPVGHFAGTPLGTPGRPPGAGEHTREVLAGLGLDADIVRAVEEAWRTRRVRHSVGGG